MELLQTWMSVTQGPERMDLDRRAWHEDLLTCRFKWPHIGRVKNKNKNACIVYLRKSISFAHRLINRYNGTAVIDLHSFLVL